MTSRSRIPVGLLWLCLALALPSCPAFCADAGPLAISVPPGFDGPIKSEENGGVTIAWVKRRPGSDGGTLLQVRRSMWVHRSMQSHQRSASRRRAII